MNFSDMFNSTMNWFKESPETAKLIGGIAVGVGTYAAQKELQKSGHANELKMENLRQENRLEFVDHEQGQKDERSAFATGINTSFDASVSGDRGALTGGGLLSKMKTARRV